MARQVKGGRTVGAEQDWLAELEAIGRGASPADDGFRTVREITEALSASRGTPVGRDTVLNLLRRAREHDLLEPPRDREEVNVAGRRSHVPAYRIRREKP